MHKPICYYRRRIGLMAIGFFLMVPAVHAQVILSILFGDKLNSDELLFGIHANYSWNNLTGTHPSDASRNLNLGLFFTYKFNDHWMGNLEAMAKYQRGAKGLAVYPTGDESTDQLFAEGTVERRISYVGLPMTVQYMTRSGFFAETGPQVLIRTKAHDLFEVDRPEGELSLEKDIEDNTSRWDFSWIAGLGYRIGKSKLTALGIRYNLGLTDVMKVEEGSQQHRQFFIYTNIPVGRGKMKSNKK